MSETRTYTNGEVTTAKAVVDRLAAERRYADAQTKVSVMRLHQELTRQAEPIQAAITDLLEKHGGAGNVAPGTDSYAAYVEEVTRLLQQGEVVIDCDPIPFASLVVRGEGGPEPVDLSPAEMSALGGLLDYSRTT